MNTDANIGHHAGDWPGHDNLGGRWQDYLHILLDRWWIVVTVFVIALTCGIYRARLQVPLYRACARLQISVELPKVLKPDDVVSINTQSAKYYKTQIIILRSRSLAEKVVAALSLHKNPDFLPGSETNANFAAALLRFTAIAPVKDTDMIDVVVTHPMPETAALIANGIAEQYREQTLNEWMEASLEALEWLRRQAQEYQRSLVKSELTLQEYKETELADFLVDRKNIILEKVQKISSELTSLETDRVSAETEWNNIKALIAAGEPAEKIAAISSEHGVRQARQEALNKEAQIAILRERYKDKHPVLEQQLLELRELNQTLSRACLDALENISARLHMLKDKEDRLRKTLEQEKKTAFEFDRKLMVYNEMVRNVEADRHLYDSILSRMKETSVAGKVKTNNVRIVDHAVPPNGPFNINTGRLIMGSGIAGIILGIALGFVVHFADDRIKHTTEIESCLGLPVLGTIPRITDKDERLRALTVHGKPHASASEAFRTMRASLALIPSANNAGVVMITSADAGSGKSLISANLAIAFADNGQKTLLVDSDLRHPCQRRLFGLDNNEKGFAHVLAGKLRWQAVVCKTDVTALDILPVGRIPPNPSDLLGSSRMRDFIQEASRKYEKIVLDCPPVLGMSDSLIILPNVTGVIFVVRFRKSHRRLVSGALQKLRAGHTPVWGVVMNNIEMRRYEYHYGYTYYGYGEQARADSRHGEEDAPATAGNV